MTKIKEPTYDSYFIYVLKCLGEGIVKEREVIFQQVAKMRNLSNELKNTQLECGKLRYEDRINWAMVYLHKAELLNTNGRGDWNITEKGKFFLNNHKEEVSLDDIKECPIAIYNRKFFNLGPIKFNKKYDLGQIVHHEEHGEGVLLGYTESGYPKIFFKKCGLKIIFNENTLIDKKISNNISDFKIKDFFRRFNKNDKIYYKKYGVGVVEFYDEENNVGVKFESVGQKLFTSDKVLEPFDEIFNKNEKMKVKYDMSEEKTDNINFVSCNNSGVGLSLIKLSLNQFLIINKLLNSVQGFSIYENKECMYLACDENDKNWKAWLIEVNGVVFIKFDDRSVLEFNKKNEDKILELWLKFK